jgi:hypothetical protein
MLLEKESVPRYARLKRMICIRCFMVKLHNKYA